MNNFTNEQHMSVKVCFLFLFDLLSLLRSYKLLTCQPAKTITSYMAKLTATVHIYIYIALMKWELGSNRYFQSCFINWQDFLSYSIFHHPLVSLRMFTSSQVHALVSTCTGISQGKIATHWMDDDNKSSPACIILYFTLDDDNKLSCLCIRLYLLLRVSMAIVRIYSPSNHKKGFKSNYLYG